MQPRLLALVIFFFLPNAIGSAMSTLSEHQLRQVHLSYSTLPLIFEVNRGQTDPLVKFLSRGPGYNLFLTSSEAVLEFAKPSAAEPGKIFNAVPERTRYLAKTRDTAVLRMKFVGTSETVRIVGLDESPSKSNYLLGNDPKRWRKNV